MKMLAAVEVVVAGRPAENLGGINIKGRNKLVANSAQVCRGRSWESVIFRRIEHRPPSTAVLRVITAKQRKC